MEHQTNCDDFPSPPQQQQPHTAPMVRRDSEKTILIDMVKKNSADRAENIRTMKNLETRLDEVDKSINLLIADSQRRNTETFKMLPDVKEYPDDEDNDLLCRCFCLQLSFK
jgi:hypothetical protein